MKTTPKDFFLYVGTVIALYMSAGSLIGLLWGIINRVFPDALNYSQSFSGGMRFAIASVIIVFPLYIFLTWITRKEIEKNSEKKDIWVRKWLIYFTLFVAGLTVVGDLIAVLTFFLNGEITARFISKVLVLLVVAGAIFAYYLYDVYRSQIENRKVSRTLVFLASLCVLGSLVWGFTVTGSPLKARNIRLDQNRANDLQSIQWQVLNYWQQKGSLPGVLSDLNDPIANFTAPKDPETAVAYEYEKTGKQSFKLCANFSLASEKSVGTTYDDTTNKSWNHEAGRFCFDRTIDSDLYPVRTAIPVKN